MIAFYQISEYNTNFIMGNLYYLYRNNILNLKELNQIYKHLDNPLINLHLTTTLLENNLNPLILPTKILSDNSFLVNK